MRPHPTLNLQVHSTAELEQLLGEQIVARDQLHAWPLSSWVALVPVSALDGRGENELVA